MNYLDEIKDCLNDIEHEKETVRVMKAVMLRRPDSTGAEMAELILIDAKRQIKDLEARLEVYRRKHFESLDEVS